MYTGLILYTTGSVSRTKFFLYWLKKFSIDLKHSQLAEKSKLCKVKFKSHKKKLLFLNFVEKPEAWP